ncbi:MAG: HDIG domain-containing protein [Candidatus Thermoplasmatota archaeon]
MLKNYLKNEKLIQHSLAVEAIMSALAEKIREDRELWGLVGLLHDIDYEYTKDNPERHTEVASQLLNDMLPPEAIDAIRSHNYTHTNQVPITALDRALIAADAVSGLIIATALVTPSKKLSDLKTETLINKFKDKSFAARCDRKRIQLCTDIGFDIESFLDISLKALKKISDKLDL